MINQWISGLLGLAVAAIAFMSLSEGMLTWSLIVLGTAIFVSSFWSVFIDQSDGRKSGIESRL